jgi:hypothetical protein
MVCSAGDMKERVWRGTVAAENGAATAAALGDCRFILQRTALEMSRSWARIRLNWRTAATQRAREAAS